MASFCRTLSIRLFSTLRILPRSGRTAWMLRSRPCFAEPPAESPSTMKISASAGSSTEQSASLPGSREFSSADLRRVRSRAFRAALAGPGRRDRLVDDLVGLLRVLLEEVARASVDDGLRRSPRIPRLPSFVLVWPSNCGSRSLTEITAVRPSRTSSPARFSSLLLEQALLLRVAVDPCRSGRSGAAEVRAALVRVDVVGEARRWTPGRRVPLHRHLDGPLLGLALDEDDLLC